MIGVPPSVSSIASNLEVTNPKDAGREQEADRLNLMDTATYPDAAAMEPATSPPPGVHAPDGTGNATPVGIRSSPPPLTSQRQSSTRNAEGERDLTPESRSDSEAETVVLPGADGFSPSKVRKKRTIKLEDKTNENGIEDDMDIDMERNTRNEFVNSKSEEVPNRSEGATSLLGKRKRSKHGGGRLDDNHTGNSSGLSSVPTSPAPQSRPNLSKRPDSKSRGSSSPSVGEPQKEKGNSREVNNDSESERYKEYRRAHRRQSSVLYNSGRKQNTDLRTKLPTDSIARHRRTHSLSPTRHSSVQRYVSSSATNGLSHKKKSIPASLRATKEHRSTEFRSDESSAGESPYPRRSRTRNLATPPTGDSSHYLAKMPPHRRKPDRYGRTLFTDACEDGDYDKAKALLAEYPEDLNEPDAAGNTPLQCASLNGHEDIVQLLLTNGCSKNCKNDLGDSPLLDAVENGHLEVVKLLLAAGVDPRARNMSGEEPIMKIDEDNEHADAIREALMAARSAYAQARPSAASHTPQAETNDSRNRRTMSHGRSNRTGQHQLYTPLNVSSLRSAAAKGDLQTVGMIAAVLEQGLDDAESLIAAAKGGHDEVLQILLAVGNANPDPPPVHGSWEYATPMLAAIGGENIKVIELLLSNVDDGRFNPAKTFRGRTYYEIAKERAGPLWEDEERLLKSAYDNYKSPSQSVRSVPPPNSQLPPRSHKKKTSDSVERSNGARVKKEVGDNPENHGTRRDHRGTTGAELSSPVRRGSGRSKKDGAEASDQDPLPSTSHKEKTIVKRSEPDRGGSPSESEPAKPRRKLVSGRDLKGEREKHKSISSVTSPPAIITTGTDDDKPKNLQRSDPKAASDTIMDRSRAINRDKSSDRMTAIRGESPAKRPRTSSTPPSESFEASNKRRRFEAEAKRHRRAESVRSSSPDHRKLLPRSEPLASKPNSYKEQILDVKRSNQKESERKSATVDARQFTHEPTKAPAHNVIKSRPVGDGQGTRPTPEIDRKAPSAEEIAAKKREAKDVREKAEFALKTKHEEHERAEKERIDQAKRHMEEARLAREASEQRKLEDQAKREKAEAELREQQKREEAEAHLKAEEDQKRQHEEQQRLQREDTERRRAAHAAERSRVRQEQEATRLSRLPPLLRWFDSLPNPATPEVAVKFKLIQGVRYDTIRPEATGESDGREQWLLNTQVALLLGEKDLQLSRYTAWERIPASRLAKQGLWRVESDMYAMVRNDLRLYNPDLADYNRNPFQNIPPNAADTLRAQTKPVFLNMELFFVKVSDFMFIVPKVSHLNNIQLDVQYHEVLPDSTWLTKLVPPTKWSQDPDRDSYLGFTPGIKSYVNGDLVGEMNAKTARTGSAPFPPCRVPRVGLAEIKSGEPEYEKRARAQDLAGASANGDVATNGRGVATNGGALVSEQTEQRAEATTMTNALTNGVAHVDWETREILDPEMANGIGMNGSL